MDRLKTDKAKRFLEEKFGKERFNGNGIARLLEEYRAWDDPYDSEVDRIVSYAIEHGYTVRSRKRAVVDGRRLLATYLYACHNIGPVELGRIFNKNHGTFSVSFPSFTSISKNKEFLDVTRRIRIDFGICLIDLCKALEVKLAKVSKSRTMEPYYKVYGGTVRKHSKMKYDAFMAKHGLTNANQAIKELIKQVEV